MDFRYKKIKIKKYRYELLEDYKTKIDNIPIFILPEVFYGLGVDGHLLIRKGYRWKGTSGLAFDTENVIRASCVHDVFYQMLREDQIPMAWKTLADKALYRLMLADGKKGLWNSFCAWYYYSAVRWFGWRACKHV